SGCGLSAISDVLDLTPIASGDSTTDQFKLTSLDLSNNSISDVSVLITSSMFPDDTDAVLTTLDISDNNICDIEGIVSQLQTEFPTLSTLTYSDQTCHCSASVSSSDHQVCREVYPDRWAVECWNGYYLDKASGACFEVCASGSELDTSSGTPPYSCITAASDVDDSIRLQVCERHTNMMAVLEVGDSSITCGCRSVWYGDDCDQLYSVHIPDKLFRGKVCDAIGNSDPLCDVTDFEMAGINENFYSYNSHIMSFEGAQYLINICRFYGANTYITSVYPISLLEQLPILCFDQTSTTYNAYIYDFNSLFTLSRLFILYIYGNEQIYDISVSFRNVGLYQMYIAHTSNSEFIPLCRSEDDNDYWTFITTVFPTHYSTDKEMYYIPNSCPLNSNPGNSTYNCDTSNASCPSIVLNEVYNSVDGVNEKQCAFIAKEGSSGECYTVHDDEIRAYLSESTNGCLTAGAAESNDVISVATLRSSLTCSSLDLSDIVTYGSISDMNEISTLQGLEYATSLTSLTLDGYDLSGDINSNAEYDKLVVQILAKAVTYPPIDSGLRILSASGCGLSAISDVLDLTPIASGDSTTDQFKLTSLDLSNNSISDVSVLITESIFPTNVLSSLEISANNICDIDAVVSALNEHFTVLSSSNIFSSGQSSCPCTDIYPLSFSKHRTCRKTSAGVYRVECWNGYYWDKNSSTCIEATTDNDKLRCQVCERNGTVPTVYMDSSEILCGICGLGYHGDSCEYVDIPDSNLRSALCLAVTNPSAHDSSCDDLTVADMATVTSVSTSTVDSFEGLQHAVNL
ncbi:Acidic leucine-rich nuclear phosphoprotein 32 like protein, partial [Aduncisulcus paluster]